jgi:YgiT-type zinc finger domain-containing protein
MKIMKCPVCHNGICKQGFTTQTFEKNGVITVFKNVPAMICCNCGMKHFDAETSADLLRRAREARKAGPELEVINLKTA